MKSHDGGPAFPRIEVEHFPAGYGHGEHCETQNLPGMSLRDYFAGQALAGGADSFCDAMGPHETATSEEDIAEHARRHAKAAYLLADAMLKEREKQS